MSKRAFQNYPRNPRDLYKTPEHAVLPLVPHLSGVDSFDEPCAADGGLVRHIQKHTGLICNRASDIEPQAPGIKKQDLFKISKTKSKIFISNTRWPMPHQKGEPAISMILHLSNIAPAWLIYSADMAHNVYFAEKLAQRCVKIVAAGRVSWMHNGDGGFDNAAWYLFDKTHDQGIAFVERAA